MGRSRDDCVWGGPGDLSYEVRVIDGALPPYPSGPSVAIVGGGAELIVTPSSLSTDIDGDGTLETFRACTSHEGLHLTLWAGPPLQGRRVWHTYFLLGYDVDPSCTPADYEGS